MRRTPYVLEELKPTRRSVRDATGMLKVMGQRWPLLDVPPCPTQVVGYNNAKNAAVDKFTYERDPVEEFTSLINVVVGRVPP